MHRAFAFLFLILTIALSGCKTLDPEQEMYFIASQYAAAAGGMDEYLDSPYAKDHFTREEVQEFTEEHIAAVTALVEAREVIRNADEKGDFELARAYLAPVTKLAIKFTAIFTNTDLYVPKED